MKDAQMFKQKAKAVTDVDKAKCDRIYDEVLFDLIERQATIRKSTSLEIRGNKNQDKIANLIREVFGEGMHTLQSVVETTMRPYLEDKGFKVLTYNPSYLVEIDWS
jgi:hypothetical protein